MTAGEQQLVQDRATRDAARAIFDARLARVRNALAERDIGARVMDEAVDTATSAAEEALAVARENRAVMVGTALALAAWMLRRPLGRLAAQLVRRADGGEPASRWARLREWTARRIRT